MLLVGNDQSTEFIFDVIESLGFESVYVGKEPSSQRRAAAYFDFEPVIQVEEFIEKHLTDLRSLKVVAAYTLLEQAKYACEYIQECLGLGGGVGRNMIDLGRNKVAMHDVLTRGGVARPQQAFFPRVEADARPPFEYPFVVKPSLGYASGGVQLVRDESEFFSAMELVKNLNRFVFKDNSGGHGVVCEEYVDGDEYCLDSLTVSGKTRLFCMCKRTDIEKGNFQDYLFSVDASRDNHLFPDLENLVERTLEALGYTDGPSHVEVRFDGREGRWVVIEAALRVGFMGHIGELYRELSGVEYNALALKASLGLMSEAELPERYDGDRCGFIFSPPGGKGGTISGIRGKDYLEREDGVKYFYFFKSVDDYVVAYPKGVEYLGIVIGAAEHAIDMRRLMNRVVHEVRYEYAV